MTIVTSTYRYKRPPTACWTQVGAVLALIAFVGAASAQSSRQEVLAETQTAAHDPREGQVDRVISLTKALVKGVEQCFNPSHTKGNTAAKNRLINLEKTALSVKASLTSGDASKLAQTAAELETQWQAFSEKAPLVARVHCDTQRRCMELGFEGHPNYPHCQPVNGNKHANIQYIQFQQLLRSLPQLLADLSP